ncbi:MAG: hypothetical protein JNK48_35110 [Bryobacterales bacterium]|nr:hypothetical protein [Bryobacterales bacterium]
MQPQLSPEKLSRSEQARINGAKSHGPVTAEGKERSSLNAVKHGVFSAHVLLRGESQEDYWNLLHSYRDLYKPTDIIENGLIQDLADARWRIDRMKRQETLEWNRATYEATYGNDAADYPADARHAMGHRQSCTRKGNPLETCRRAEARYRRDFDRALKALQQHRKQKSQNEPEPQPVQPQPEPASAPQDPEIYENEPSGITPLASEHDPLPNDGTHDEEVMTLAELIRRSIRS